MLTKTNAKTVEQIAREMVERYGADAVTLLRGRADQARVIGDEVGAKAWCDIAVVAEGMLKDPCRLLDAARL